MPAACSGAGRVDRRKPAGLLRRARFASPEPAFALMGVVGRSRTPVDAAIQSPAAVCGGDGVIDARIVLGGSKRLQATRGETGGAPDGPGGKRVDAGRESGVDTRPEPPRRHACARGAAGCCRPGGAPQEERP